MADTENTESAEKLNITKDTPRETRTIGGRSLSVPQPFAAGMPLTPGTAQMLNQTYAENISNNLRSKFDENMSDADCQKLVDEYVQNYVPGVRTGGGGAAALSPLDREIRNLATQKANDHLKAKGIKRKDIDFVAFRDGIIAKYRDALEPEAKKVLAAKQKAEAGVADDFDIDPTAFTKEAA